MLVSTYAWLHLSYNYPWLPHIQLLWTSSQLTEESNGHIQIITLKSLGPVSFHAQLHHVSLVTSQSSDTTIWTSPQLPEISKKVVTIQPVKKNYFQTLVHNEGEKLKGLIEN